jgi:hypothetical protein
MKKSSVIIWWLVLACLIAGGIGNPNIHEFWRLAKHGIRCAGVVTEMTLANHNTVRYQYTVGNSIFSGQTQSDAPNPPAERLRVGDSLVVFYDPAKPSSSTLSDPHGLLKNEVVSVGLMSIVVPTFIIFAVRARSKKWNGKTVVTQKPNGEAQR